MNGNERADYMSDNCDGVSLFDGDWQYIVDMESGVVFTVNLRAHGDIPRRVIAQMLDAGFRP